jgi:hypothetical protein
MKPKTIALACILLALGALGILSWIQLNKRHPSTEYLKPDYSVTAPALLREYNEQEALANKKYNDKVIEVDGEVLRVEATDSTKKVTMGEWHSLSGVICEFSSDQKSRINKIEPGHHIRVKGVCTGMLMDVILVRCVLMNK